MSTLFLFLLLFNFTISADDMLERVGETLQTSQNQSLNKELIEKAAPEKEPSKIIKRIKLVLGGGVIIIILSLIKVPVKDEEKKTNNQPTIPPAKSEDIFMTKLKKNVETRLSGEDKELYKTIGIHYLFGDLLAILYIYDNYNWINNNGETDWKYNDANPINKKIQFILELNKILENIFTKMNKNIQWYWDRSEFKDFLKDKLNKKNDNNFDGDDKINSMIESFNTKFNKKKQNNNFQLKSYGLSNNEAFVTIDNIEENNTSANEEFIFKGNNYDNSTKTKTIEDLYYEGVDKPPENFLTHLKDHYWPFVEKVFKNLDTINGDLPEQLKKELDSLANIEERTNNYNTLKTLFLSFIKEQIKYIKKTMENGAVEKPSMTLLTDRSWNLDKDEPQAIFSYLLVVYLQFITQKVEQGFRWEPKGQKINTTIFEQIAQTFSNPPKK